MNHVTIAVERNLSDCEVARKKLAQVKTVVLLRSILNSDVTMRIFYALNTYPVGGGDFSYISHRKLKFIVSVSRKKSTLTLRGSRGSRGDTPDLK